MPITWIDLDLNFIPNPITGDISRNVGDMAVIRAVENLVQFNSYDVPFHPEVAGNQRFLLFENFSSTNTRLIEKELQDLITNYETRATVNYISVDADVQNNGYNVTVSFFIKGSTDPITVTGFLERLR